MKRASPLIAVLFIGLLASSLCADPLVTRARQLEKAGDGDGAARLYSAWLAANPGASGSAAVFGLYRAREQSLGPLLETSGSFLQSARGVPGAAAQFEQIARLYELTGRTEEARDAYVAAHAEGGADSSLVSAFFLSLQMNDADRMAATLAQMSGTGEAADLLLGALSDARGGNSLNARAVLVGLSDQTADPEVALKALWILYQSARSSGDSAAQVALRTKLANRFAGAPETALAAGSSANGSSPRATVVQMPAPGPFDIRSIQADPTPPPSAGAGPNQPTVVPRAPTLAVQAGSFLMRENADDLVTQLGGKGFSPVVVHEMSQGKDRYRVLAGTGLNLEEAKTLLKRLSDAGYRGFILPLN